MNSPSESSALSKFRLINQKCRFKSMNAKRLYFMRNICIIHYETGLTEDSNKLLYIEIQCLVLLSIVKYHQMYVENEESSMILSG